MDTTSNSSNWSDVSTWASVSTIVQGIVVLVSVVFIIHQLKQSTRQLQQNTLLARAANAQSLTEQAAAFNAILYQDDKLCALWYSFGKGLEKRDSRDIERLRYREMLVQWLILHQNIFYQWRQDLLDKEIYDSWAYDLRITVRAHNLLLIDVGPQAFFPGEFGAHIASIQKEAAGPTKADVAKSEDGA